MKRENYQHISDILKRVSQLSPEKYKLLERLSQQTEQSLLTVDLEDGFYTVEWREQSRLNPEETAEIPPSIEAGSWLIFADQGGFGETLAAVLQAHDQTPILVYPATTYQRVKANTWKLNPSHFSDFEQLFHQVLAAPPPLQGVIHLWSLDTVSAEDLSIDSLVEAERIGCGSALHLIQILSQSTLTSPPRLWLVTQGAAAVEDQPLAIAQTPLWGLGKTLAWEHPELWGGLIDLSPDPTAETAPDLWAEIGHANGEDQVALRDKKRYVARLVRSRQPAPLLPTFKADAAYLIVGGLGALGRQVAEWMVSRGARNLVLTGRQHGSKPDKTFLKSLELSGAKITVVQADVTNQADLTQLFETIRTDLPPLCGVVHAAGVIDDGALAQQDWSQFTRVMAPKVQGTWLLHRLTQDIALDFFVGFSSAASLLGSPGQGNYAAANSFLDGLMHHRQAQGLPGLSLNWGAWADAGMAANLTGRDRARLSARGLKPIAPNQGLQALGQLLRQNTAQDTGQNPAQNPAQVGVLSVDWSKLAAQFPLGFNSPFLSDILSDSPQAPPKTISETTGDADTLHRQLLDIPPPQRQARLTGYLRQHIAKALQLEMSHLSVHDNLLERGVDSLIMMEVINRIRQDLQIMVYPREFYQKPNIAELSVYLAGEWERANQNSGAGGGGIAPPLNGASLNGAPLNGAALPTETIHRNGHGKIYAAARQIAWAPSQPPAIAPKLPGIVFILSSPRSGSTLLRTMLAGHPTLFAPPELHLLPFNTMAEWHSEETMIDLRRGLQQAFMALMHVDAEAAQAIVADLVSDQATVPQVYSQLQDLAKGRRLVDKSPTYASKREILERAEDLFEAPQYIHLARHPYAVIESFVRMRLDKLIGAKTANPYYLAEEIWATSNQNSLDLKSQVGPERYRQIRYEDLVQNPEGVMQRLCEFLKVPFDPVLLAPYEGARMIGGGGGQFQAQQDPNFLSHQKIDAQLADGWKAIALPHPLGGFAKHVAAELGYELPQPIRRRSPTSPLSPSLPPPSSLDTLEDLSPAPRDRTLPLSFAQQRLWFLTQLEAESSVYNIRSAFTLTGALNLAALEQAVGEVVGRHEVLRTLFPIVDGMPVQAIQPESAVAIPMIDLQPLPAAEREREVTRWLAEEAQRPFDLSQGPLLRLILLQLGMESHILLLTMHHIVSDGWSLQLFIHELSVLYKAYLAGADSPLSALSLQYADFAHWQRQWLGGERLAIQLAYWKQQLAGAPPMLALPTDHPRPEIQTYQGGRQPFQLSASLTQQLKTLGRQSQATLFMTLLAAFFGLLYRYSGQPDMVVGAPVANRNRREIEPLIGFFVNTLALRLNLQDNPTFQGVLEQVRQVALDAYAHQDLPFEKLVEELQPERSLSHSPLFQVMFVWQNAPMGDLALPGLTITPLESSQVAAKFDLTLWIWETGQGLRGEWRYNIDLFEADTISRMADHFQTLLQAIATQPQQPLSDIPLLNPAERRQQLAAWNNTQADYSLDHCLHQHFEAQVQRTPDAVAVIYQDQQLTYRQLNRQANQLANHLQRLGVGPEVLVGLCLERSFEMVTAILAVLKAGGAYAPMEPTYPKARLTDILTAAQPPVLLTQASALDRLPDYGGYILCLDQDRATIAQANDQNPASAVALENLAYVIYTSGSTGRPKGVAIEHYSIVNYLQAILEQVKIEVGDQLALVSTLAADLGHTILFPALCAGGCLHVLSQEQATDPDILAAYFDRHAIDILKIAPSHLAALQSGVQPGRGLPRKQLILGGEASSCDWINQLQQLAPDCHILNHYGPTEATVGALTYPVPTPCPETPSGTLPLGRPLANVQAYILDPQLQPVPVGAPGELYIGGAGLARGYLNLPELTTEKFIPHPFSPEPNARLYRTGDLGRYRPDGAIEFLGRIDRQVKIRGFRIELAEVEGALMQHPRVQTAVVIDREDQPGDRRLAAYVVAQPEPPTARELRGFLTGKLPEYMSPSAFVMLDTLPLTSNGKVDRRALPQPGSPESSLEAGPVAYRTLTEEVVAGIWADILGVDVGADDNFFDRGGHSLLATRAISRLRETFSVDLPLHDFFECPTVAKLGRRIDTLRQANAGLQELAIQPVSRQAELPLSFSQERLWFLDQMQGESVAYNVPGAVHLSGCLDVEALERAIAEIKQRHQVLRTTFPTVDGLPIQVISPDASVMIPVVDLKALLEGEQLAEVKRLVADEAQRPFDLASGPLLRINLLRLGAQSHVLLVNLHHIISDGWSRAVFIREIAVFYDVFSKGEPSPLPELPIQYADFAHWQRQWLTGDVLKTQLTYWKQQLAGAPPSLDLPTDRPRPAVHTFRGCKESFVLNPDLTQKLKTLSQQSGATLYMTLLAAFVTLLYRYSGQSDIVVGSPIANRNRIELEPLIGFFLNTLVLRSDLQGDPPFLELLSRVRQVALDAYAHQDIPFEKLVEELKPERQLSHFLWFQVMFILQNVPRQKLELPGLSLTLLGRENWENFTAKFDLTLVMEEIGMEEANPKLEGVFEYNTDLFDAATISRMVGHFQCLLEGIVANPQQQIAALPMLTTAEQTQLLSGWSGAPIEASQAEAAAASASPENPAETAPDHELARLLAELEALSDQTAQQLLNDESQASEAYR